MNRTSNSFFITETKSHVRLGSVQTKPHLLKPVIYKSSQILPTLNQSFSSNPSKFTSTTKYVDTFKYISKIKDLRSYHIQPQSPISSYLSKIQEKKILPLQLGLLKEKGINEKFEVINSLISAQYVEPLCACLKTLKIQQLILKKNGLSDQSLLQLLSVIDFKYISVVKICENVVVPNSLERLSRLFAELYSNLSVLGIENCNLGDKSVILLMSSLMHLDMVKEVYLGKNRIEEDGAVAIARFIFDTEVLEVLDISWNRIRGYGGKDICKALSSSTSLKFLNISWNSLGSPSEAQCSKHLSDSLSTNSILLHLDLSFTQFTLADCEIIRTGLDHNTTLIGLDFEGNPAKIDSLGKIITKKHQKTVSNHDSSELEDSKSEKNMCWICGRWNEVEFKLPDKFLNVSQSETVKLHLQFDDYRPCDMSKGVVKMCPPGSVLFFFSYKAKVYLDHGFAKTKTTVSSFPGIYQVNYLVNKPAPLMLWMQLKPRVLPRAGVERFDETPAQIFKEFYVETSEFVYECFVEDVSRSNLKSFLGSEYEKALAHLRPRYSAVKETYQTLAAKAWIDWEGWENSLKRFFITQGILESKDKILIEVVDMLRTFRYWNSTVEIYFTRFNFVELVVRVAISKYYHTKEVKKIAQSVKLFFRNYFDCFEKNNSQDFRVEKLYTKPVQLVLSQNKALLFKKFFEYAVDGFLTFEDFHIIFSQILKKKELQQVFILSKESSLVKSYFDDKLKLSEYLEAATRCIYKLYQQNPYFFTIYTSKTEASEIEYHESPQKPFEEFLSLSLSTFFS